MEIGLLYGPGPCASGKDFAYFTLYHDLEYLTSIVHFALVQCDRTPIDSCELNVFPGKSTFGSPKRRVGRSDARDGTKA